MSRARALLVDLDGTLADTAAANCAAYAAALAEVGVTVTRAEFEPLAHGRNWRQFLPELLSGAGNPADPAEVARRKTALYAGQMDQVVINQALAALLENARPAWRTALVTTASGANAWAILRHHGLDVLFDAVITGDDVRRHKPDPEAYVLAAERLGVAPADCVVIEDSDIGCAAAQAFGAPVLRVVL